MTMRRLPIRIRKVSGEAFVITVGDDLASLYLYFRPNENRDVAPRRLQEDDAKALAQDIARALREAWRE
jgi:hypothetical protein